MRFKPRPLEFPATDPFKDDLLDRKKHVEALTDFLNSLTEPFVLAIDSPFGTGKSTFLKMLLQHLRNQGSHCLFFNAWENDFTESALVSLIGEVGSEIEKLKLGEKNPKVQEFFKKTKNVGAALLKAALPAAVKAVTYNLLDVTQIKESMKDVDLGKAGEEFAKKQIEKYQADKKTIHHFKTELAGLFEA